MAKKIIDGNLQVKGSVEEDIISQIEVITYYDSDEDDDILKITFPKGIKPIQFQFTNQQYANGGIFVFDYKNMFIRNILYLNEGADGELEYDESGRIVFRGRGTDVNLQNISLVYALQNNQMENDIDFRNLQNNFLLLKASDYSTQTVGKRTIFEEDKLFIKSGDFSSNVKPFYLENRSSPQYFNTDNVKNTFFSITSNTQATFAILSAGSLNNLQFRSKVRSNTLLANGDYIKPPLFIPRCFFKDDASINTLKTEIESKGGIWVVNPTDWIRPFLPSFDGYISPDNIIYPFTSLSLRGTYKHLVELDNGDKLLLISTNPQTITNKSSFDGFYDGSITSGKFYEGNDEDAYLGILLDLSSSGSTYYNSQNNQLTYYNLDNRSIVSDTVERLS